MNLELRSRIYQTNLWNQHLALSLVPFYDAGRVWDGFDQLSLRNFRGSPGLGARIAWNQATVLRFDYATSFEDDQFFFTLEHPF
jgi:hemolysin activation/secretion protein